MCTYMLTFFTQYSAYKIATKYTVHKRVFHQTTILYNNSTLVLITVSFYAESSVRNEYSPDPLGTLSFALVTQHFYLPCSETFDSKFYAKR